MLSHAASGCSQCGQCEPLRTMSGGAASSFAPSSSISRASRFQKYSKRAGRRRITTLRKLPTIRPSTPAAATQKARGRSAPNKRYPSQSVFAREGGGYSTPFLWKGGAAKRRGDEGRQRKAIPLNPPS